MDKSKEILIDEISKLDPTWSKEDINEVVSKEPIFDAANNAIKRHAKEMLNELAESNPSIKKALDEIQSS